MTTIGSIGIGLFILIIVWLVALILFVVAVRLQSHLGWFCLSFAASLTITLSIIPLEKKYDSLEESIPEEKDYSLIYKYVLFATLATSALGIFLIFFLTHCIEQIHPKRIARF